MSCCQNQSNIPNNKSDNKNKQKRQTVHIHDLQKKIKELQDKANTLSTQNSYLQEKNKKIENQNIALNLYKVKSMQFYQQASRQVEQNTSALKALLEVLSQVSHVQSIKYIGQGKQVSFKSISNFFDDKIEQMGPQQYKIGFNIEQIFSLSTNNIISSRKTFLNLVALIQIMDKIIANGYGYDYTAELRGFQKLQEQQAVIYEKILGMMTRLKGALEKQALDFQKLSQIQEKLQKLSQMMNMRRQTIYNSQSQQKDKDSLEKLLDQLKQQLKASEEDSQTQIKLINSLKAENYKLQGILSQQKVRQRQVAPTISQQQRQQVQQEKRQQIQTSQKACQGLQSQKNIVHQNMMTIKQLTIKLQQSNQQTQQLKIALKIKESANEKLLKLLQMKQQETVHIKDQITNLNQKIRKMQTDHREHVQNQQKIIVLLKKQQQNEKISNIKAEGQLQHKIQEKFKLQLSAKMGASRSNQQEESRLNKQLFIEKQALQRQCAQDLAKHIKQRNNLSLLLENALLQKQNFQRKSLQQENVIHQKIKRLQQLRVKLQMQNKILQQDMDVVKRGSQQLRQQKIQLMMNNEKLSKELQQTKHILISRFQEESLDQQIQNHQRIRSYSFIQHKTLFISDLLEKRKEQKKFLIDSIQNHMGLDIQKTKMLYDFNRDSKNNFNNYILGHSNLVLIVQTKKAIFASYYSGLFEQKDILDAQALIISMNNRQSYKLNNFKNNPNKDPRDNRVIRGMKFDKYYLIFGNAQIRIKSGEKKVFSNFGIINGYFDNRKHKVDSILGEGSNNETQMVNYEIHEVIFAMSYEQVEA